VSRVVRDAPRRIDLLKLAERPGQREWTTAYLIDAPTVQHRFGRAGVQKP
jgi:hypothetical protein